MLQSGAAACVAREDQTCRNSPCTKASLLGGFTEVEITSDGSERQAKAHWPLEDETAEIPRQIKKLVEIAEKNSEPQIPT